MQDELNLTPSPIPVNTTAIYPNRQRDKARVEAIRGLKEKGNETVRLLTPRGNHFSTGYTRIVYGDHGPYIEFERRHIVSPLKQKFPGKSLPSHCYYEWLTPEDGSPVKVYDQKRDVKHLPNPPAGGHRGNRAEGYADYKPGMLYVSPFELTTLPPPPKP